MLALFVLPKPFVIVDNVFIKNTPPPPTPSSKYFVVGGGSDPPSSKSFVVGYLGGAPDPAKWVL